MKTIYDTLLYKVASVLMGIAALVMWLYFLEASLP